MPNATSVLNAVERQSAGETPPPSIRDVDKRCGCSTQHDGILADDWPPAENGAFKRVCADSGFAAVVAPKRKPGNAAGVPNGRWHCGIITPSGNLLRSNIKRGWPGRFWRGDYATAVCAAANAWGKLKHYRKLTLWRCAQCDSELTERAAVASCWRCLGTLCVSKCAVAHAKAANCDDD